MAISRSLCDYERASSEIAAPVSAMMPIFSKVGGRAPSLIIVSSLKKHSPNIRRIILMNMTTVENMIKILTGRPATPTVTVAPAIPAGMVASARVRPSSY